MVYLDVYLYNLFSSAELYKKHFEYSDSPALCNATNKSVNCLGHNIRFKFNLKPMIQPITLLHWNFSIGIEYLSPITLYSAM
jgi:hypothetical protein